MDFGGSISQGGELTSFKERREGPTGNEQRKRGSYGRKKKKCSASKGAEGK